MINIKGLIWIWIYIDPTSDPMTQLAALYVLYAVLDKTGGFSRKAGVTKKKMAHGIIRPFIFKRTDQEMILKALNSYDVITASTRLAFVKYYVDRRSVA